MKNNLTTEEQSERQAKIRQMQTDMFVLQSDKSRLTRKQNLLREEIRKMKIDFGHLKAELEIKTNNERALAKEIALADEALARAKKQMGTIK
jgi:predicted nuclease with TOPRIM domain